MPTAGSVLLDATGVDLRALAERGLVFAGTDFLARRFYRSDAGTLLLDYQPGGTSGGSSGKVALERCTSNLDNLLDDIHNWRNRIREVSAGPWSCAIHRSRGFRLLVSQHYEQWDSSYLSPKATDSARCVSEQWIFLFQPRCAS